MIANNLLPCISDPGNHLCCHKFSSGPFTLQSLYGDESIYMQPPPDAFNILYSYIFLLSHTAIGQVYLDN